MNFNDMKLTTENTENAENTERATPETDAEVTTFTSISKLKQRFECSTGKVSAEFARRLERERDDAREERDKLKQLLAADSENVDAYLGVCLERDEAREHLREIKEYGTEEINAAVELRQKLASALVERDEAREELQRAVQERHDFHWELIDAVRERNEARDQVKELIYIAGRAIDLADLDFENDKFGVVAELRDGLEKIQEGAK